MDREREVYAKLDQVYDPELDQPLTELGFIESARVRGNDVEVVFRLPTYWCSPNFAFIMAEDIQRSVSELDWAEKVEVNLIDHCASGEINRGVTRGKRFSESTSEFGASDGELDELRKKFVVKSFLARGERLMKHLLREHGDPYERFACMTFDELEARDLSGEGDALRRRYAEKRAQLGIDGALAFTTPEGEPLQPDEVKDFLLNAKRTRLSMEFNAHYCRGLLEARYNLAPADAAST
ncbi:hypothetical protein BG53_10510 [Paenibacillus darwinianus]|uniref:MIP18 family-like domain-containing protein n=1 Tax=Paenibacillus darwinianus TaxID=1380763 RepID=A0A9W5RZA8_9BACL|nr:iron-sulfur cluster assembly protein [Paenibacillus darwinianus]EXX84738.1 hypothetical protein BG52_10025 [Paenibacillus darwinianus]EXX84744.1 hypothetical protein BG53_10510 [Paenibacillus darwinianus]EXX84858.1 hypothetical protein CH50_10705 [Paenibacillus darwinianus]